MSSNIYVECRSCVSLFSLSTSKTPSTILFDVRTANASIPHAEQNITLLRTTWRNLTAFSKAATNSNLSPLRYRWNRLSLNEPTVLSSALHSTRHGAPRAPDWNGKLCSHRTGSPPLAVQSRRRVLQCVYNSSGIRAKIGIVLCLKALASSYSSPLISSS